MGSTARPAVRCVLSLDVVHNLFNIFSPFERKPLSDFIWLVGSPTPIIRKKLCHVDHVESYLLSVIDFSN